MQITSSINGTLRRSSSSARRFLDAVGMMVPSGLDSVGTASTAFTGWVSSASSNASSDRPARGSMGISTTRSPNDSSTRRKPK
nr:hypothetical protein [Thiomonas sp.]